MGSNYPIQPGLHILLSGFLNSLGNNICSSFLRVLPEAVCLSLMYCQYLPVLSPHSVQFPPFADAVTAKHLAFTLIRGSIEGVKQLCDRRVQIYSDYTLLAFAISLFPLLLRGGLALTLGCLPLEFPRHTCRKSLGRL